MTAVCVEDQRNSIEYFISLCREHPLIDEAVKTTFSLPNSWKLIAQMPFGNPVADAAAKTYLPLEERFHIYS